MRIGFAVAKRPEGPERINLQAIATGFCLSRNETGDARQELFGKAKRILGGIRNNAVVVSIRLKVPSEKFSVRGRSFRLASIFVGGICIVSAARASGVGVLRSLLTADGRLHHRAPRFELPVEPGANRLARQSGRFLCHYMQAAPPIVVDGETWPGSIERPVPNQRQKELEHLAAVVHVPGPAHVFQIPLPNLVSPSVFRE
jgi:hypothetical protein